MAREAASDLQSLFPQKAAQVFQQAVKAYPADLDLEDRSGRVRRVAALLVQVPEAMDLTDRGLGGLASIAAQYGLLWVDDSRDLLAKAQVTLAAPWSLGRDRNWVTLWAPAEVAPALLGDVAGPAAGKLRQVLMREQLADLAALGEWRGDCIHDGSAVLVLTTGDIDGDPADMFRHGVFVGRVRYDDKAPTETLDLLVWTACFMLLNEQNEAVALPFVFARLDGDLSSRVRAVNEPYAREQAIRRGLRTLNSPFVEQMPKPPGWVLDLATGEIRDRTGEVFCDGIGSLPPGFRDLAQQTGVAVIVFGDFENPGEDPEQFIRAFFAAGNSGGLAAGLVPVTG